MTAQSVNEEHWQRVLNHYSHPDQVAVYGDRAAAGLRPFEEVIVEKFHQPPGKVLDVGCGAGREAFALMEMGYDVVGVDRTRQLLDEGKRIAAEKGVEVDFIWTDGRDLACGERVFDHAVIWAQVLGNVPGRENRLAMLQQCYAALKLGGKLSFSVHDRKRTEAKAREMGLVEQDGLHGLEKGDFVLGEKLGNNYWHLYEREEILELCVEAGFVVLDCRRASEWGDEVRDNVWVCVCERGN